MNEQERLNKNNAIREAGIKTRLKRQEQVCKTFKFKIDHSSLTLEQREALKMFFVEAKRVYNYILGLSRSGSDIFKLDYKDFKNITYLDKDKNIINYNINYIGSSVIQDTHRLIKEAITALAKRKAKGGKVDQLDFKTECNSIRFKQYGITHSVKGNRIKIQGIKKPLRVSGLKQLSKYDNIDYTIACLLYDGYDYYISLACYIPKEQKTYKNDIIGVDFGCESTITTSIGKKYDIQIGESDRLKGLQKRLASQTKRSNNWCKTKQLIRKEYNHINNQKNDISNKIVHDLTAYRLVVTQDDPLNEWHEIKKHEVTDTDGKTTMKRNAIQTSRTVQHSVLGRVKSKLKHKNNVVFLDRWFPTTKHCFVCGSDINMPLENRIFTCPVCGNTLDRDIHAAQNMVTYYNNYVKLQPAGTVGLMPRREVTYKSYRNRIEKEAQSSSAAE